MKKISTIASAALLCASLSTPAQASDYEEQMLSLVSVGSTVMGAGLGGMYLTTFGNAFVGTAIFAAAMSTIYIGGAAGYYQGLDNDSVEVLAGSAEIDDLPAISQFKEDLIANSETIEQKVFEETGEEVSIQDLSDEDIATLALHASQNQ
ncbi:MAG: hypothetical protein CME64_09925 [Halobacteriovoraceae bacterium]|nr:hypothetical protein [Halobacteriovoraceae bacterium]|tara:strand:+ start:75850 stop:76299 length:450 start_codon:yes stop_codon:yes gene_type:complete